MAELLHEQTGLGIKRNDKNRFVVVTLHYTADPAKRSDEWKEEAKAGMSDAKWAKEYEIDYTALFGEKVFPRFIANKDKFVVREPLPEIPKHLPCWGGLDYGSRNPSSFHVYTILDGVTYSIWELFEPCKAVPAFAAKMKECPYWDQIRYIAADPQIWYPSHQQREGVLTSIYELFTRERVTKLIKGITDEQAWLATMHKHWENPEDPTFKIYVSCPNQIREFEAATYATMSDRLALQQNYRENIVDHDNHSLDDCKYFMNSGARPRSRSLTLPRLVKSYIVKY